MRVQLDKIASSTANVGLHRQVVLGDDVPARPGTVIAVRVIDEKHVYNQVEDTLGRMRKVHAGDILAGVLGERRALRGYSGVVPDEVRKGDHLHLLNLGGIIGQCTSHNPEVGPPARVEVLGTVLRFPELGRRIGEPANIFPGPVPLSSHVVPLPPAIYVVGSCMHAGKTAAACALTRQLTRRGHRVGVAKITGVALRRDVLEMQDHGALVAYTFADAGLPSTCGDDVDALGAARGCLNALAEERLDVLVVELGDGLLGEYGVMEILADPELKRACSAVVLSATDPVAAWGGGLLLDQLGYKAAAVTGPATDNEAGNTSIRTRMGVPAINARKNAEELTATVIAGLSLPPAEVA